MWNPAAVCSSIHAVQLVPKWAGEGVNGKHTEFMGDIKAIRSIRHDYALVNLCWLFPVAIFSFTCWKQLPGRLFSITFQEMRPTHISTNLSPLGWVQCLPFFSLYTPTVAIIFLIWRRAASHHHRIAPSSASYIPHVIPRTCVSLFGLSAP